MRIETLADGVSDRWVTIYALCEPIDRWKTGRVRYVGKTVRQYGIGLDLMLAPLISHKQNV